MGRVMNESSGLEIRYRWNGSDTRVVSYSRTRLVMLVSCAAAVILGLGIQIGRMSWHFFGHEQLKHVQESQKPSTTELDLQQGSNVPPATTKESPNKTEQAADAAQTESSAKLNTAEPNSKISIKSVQTKSLGDKIELNLTIINRNNKVQSGSIDVTAGETVSSPVRFSMRNSVTKTIVLNKVNVSENRSTELPIVVTIRDRDGRISKQETFQIKTNVTSATKPNQKSQFASRSNE
jgi:hypothetical protein